METNVPKTVSAALQMRFNKKKKVYDILCTLYRSTLLINPIPG